MPVSAGCSGCGARLTLARLGVDHGVIDAIDAIDAIDVALFAVGWTLGWVLLWRPRTLPSAPEGPRATVAVVIPARDEADALADVVTPLLAQRRPGDRIIVVDDYSDDGTADVARALGADVVRPPPPPDGWLGKPNACFAGAMATDQEVLVFLDADVRPGPTLLDDLTAALAETPDAVISVQPWHRMEAVAEQGSALCNVTSLMGSGAFTPFGERVAGRVAFGPVIAVDRAAYDRVGGHGNDDVRGRHTEDIALGRAIGRSRLFVGSPTTTAFRMYPGGFGDLVRGWSRSIATGARSTRWWLTLATAAWVCSIAGGWIAAPLTYPLIAAQVWVLGRRAGSIRPAAALLFPILVVVFVAIFVRSVALVLLGRQVSWKGRAVDARSG